MTHSSLLKKLLLTSFRCNCLVESNTLQPSFYPFEHPYQSLDFAHAATKQKKRDALPTF